MNFFKKNQWNIFFIILAFLLLRLIIDVILFYTTQFEKQITVSNKYHLQRSSRYHVVTKNGTNYRVTNVWFKGDFNRGDKYGILENEKSYLVKGYGIRIPLLNMYKNIYSVKKI